MVKSRIILLLLVCVCILSGCRRRAGSAAPTGWESVSPQVDSLTREISLSLRYRVHVDSIGALVLKFQRLPVPSGSEKEMAARVHYWKGRVAWRRGNLNLRNVEFDSATKVAPPPTAEYLAHLIQYHTERRSDFSAQQWYEHKLREIDYFRSRDDYIRLYDQYNEMMELMREIGLHARARYYLEKCNEASLNIGGHLAELDNKINLASLSSDTGDFEQAEKLNRELRADSVYMSGWRNYQLVNHNIYLSGLDTAALYDAWRSMQVHGSTPDLRRRIYTSVVTAAVDNNDPSLASRISDSLRLEVDEMDLGFRKVMALKAIAQARDLCGDVAGAAGAYRRYALAADSLAKELRRDNIANVDVAMAIRETDDRIRHEKRVADMELWGVIAASLLVIGALVVLSEKRIRRLKRQRREAEELKKIAENRQIAVQLNADRRGLALEKAAESLGNIKKDGDAAALQTLERILSNRNTNEIGTDNFLELFTQQYPLFISRLREVAPRISDSALRLAGYIAIGLGTKEIAVLMNVRLESVRQAKWRLRRTLGLENEEELFPFLSGCLHRE